MTSVPGFINEVLKYFDDWPDAAGSEPELWFRGVNDANYSLLPGAYWRSDCDELSLFVGFQNAAPLYLLREPLDDWDWYYVMQHYGLPTRLWIGLRVRWRRSTSPSNPLKMHLPASGYSIRLR